MFFFSMEFFQASIGVKERMQHLRIILIFTTIILLRHLCIAILCPVLVGNAVLSSTCSRQSGESCSFSCTQGYVPNTMDNIVCTSNGTWNLNITTLCSDELRPFLSKEKASLYLQVRSKRVKRDINEECSELDGCTYEEIKEIGVTDVCAWMKNRLCSKLNCGAGYICVTTVNNCGVLNNYRVACQEILCPVPVGNAVLSSTCNRKIGDSCSFSCNQGHLSTTLDNIVCTSDGTWDLNPTTLCSPILCPKSVGNAVISPNCSRMIGKSCTYSCIHGYFPTTLDNVVCTSEGSWNMDIMDNDTLCSLVHCPLAVINGNISSSCRGLTGEECYVICDSSINPVNIVCLSSGSWDKDTSAICSLKNESESSPLEDSRVNMTFLYAGTSVAGALVVVIIIAGVVCQKIRRGSKNRNVNQGMPSNTENRTYFESVNSAYEEPCEHVYCGI